MKAMSLGSYDLTRNLFMSQNDKVKIVIGCRRFHDWITTCSY